MRAGCRWNTQNTGKYLFLFLAFSLSHFLTFAQENIFTAGFQYRPIFPSEFFGAGTKSVLQKDINYSIGQKTGSSWGMIIRRGFTKRLSMDFGINYTKRNFGLRITDTTFTGKSDFKIICYEIPVQLLIFLHASEKGFLTSSMGMAWDMYPTNVLTQGTYFRNYSIRNSHFQIAALAGIGYEYRTKKDGFFYLGAGYHLPLSYAYLSSVTYKPINDIAHLKLGGNYLTLDFRYYFPAEKVKDKKEKKKKK